MSKPTVCSLFSGIGGFEVALTNVGFQIVALCENDSAAQAVLTKHFPGIELHENIETLSTLPTCDIVTAGWPCQDLSQAGRMAGHYGLRSGLISHLFRLLDSTSGKPATLLLENVPFALRLHKGHAIKTVLQALEDRGYSWAFRILDSLAFGVPQRRRRIYIVASRTVDPVAVLFHDYSAPPEEDSETASPILFGFYWTEGNRGLGWTVDAIPPLKGGSGLAIPSPPAIWNRATRAIVSPGICDAERLQGFPANWTVAAAETRFGERSRWRLVGNAV